MNLHEDSELFDDLVAETAQAKGLPEVYVEKDYWVTNALRNLARSQYADHVVFKGGTSLSKAYGLIDRFSEDIDLVVFSETRSSNALKRLLKQVERVAGYGLVLLEDDPRNSKNSSIRKQVFQYPRAVDGSIFGQASPELLIEVNQYTHPEPVEKRALQTFIAEMLVKNDRADIVTDNGLEPFEINVLSAKRTLVEKMLGVIKDSHHDEPVRRLSVRIRHLYDICLILRHDEYQEFIVGPDFLPMCKICVSDEKKGFFGKYFPTTPLPKAPIFTQFEEWIPDLEKTYAGDFAQLVYRDLPPMTEIQAAINRLHTALMG